MFNPAQVAMDQEQLSLMSQLAQISQGLKCGNIAILAPADPNGDGGFAHQQVSDKWGGLNTGEASYWKRVDYASAHATTSICSVRSWSHSVTISLAFRST